VIPSVFDTFYGASEMEITKSQGSTRTANMFLLGGSFLCAGGLLNVDGQFLFCFVFVHRSGGIVNFVAIDVKASARAPSVRPVTGTVMVWWRQTDTSTVTAPHPYP